MQVTHASSVDARSPVAAEIEGGVERLLRPPVVGRVVEHHAQPLVELGGDRRQAVLEGECEPGLHRRQAALVVAAQSARDAFQAKGAGAQVQAVGRGAFVSGGTGELDRRRVLGAVAQVVAQGQALDGRVGRPVRAANASAAARRAATAPSRSSRRSCTAASRRWAVASASPGADGGQLPPCRRSVGEVARPLRAVGEGLEQGDAPLLVVARRPQLERLLGDAGRVAVGVHGARLLRRPHERLARTRLVAGAEPVRRRRRRGPVARLERLGDAAMQDAALQPRHVGVEGVTGERVAERAAAELVLAHEPVLDQLVHAVRARQRGDDLQLEHLAGDRGGLGGGPALGRQVGGAQEHGVADRLRHLAALGERSSPRASSSTKNGTPRARSWIARAAGRRWRRFEDLGEQLRRVGQPERRQRELVEVADAAQLVAQAAQRVVAREAVGAVAGDGQHRNVDERREQLERRVVGPLQVVEEQEQRARGREVGEGAADGLRDGGGIAGRRGLAQLGQQQREVRAQRAAVREAVGNAAQVRPQRRDDRRVRRGAGARRGPAQHLGVARSASDSASRVLPTPASPASSTSEPLPRRARSNAASSSVSSACRPTSAPRVVIRRY